MARTDNSESRGNRPAEYHTSIDEDKKREAGQVKMWRMRVLRASGKLNISSRVADSKRGDEYLDGTKEDKTRRRIYLRYLPSLLEELHRKTLPAIPVPRVEARSPAASLPAVTAEGLPGPSLADMSRSLMDLCFNSPYSDVSQVCEQLQWDDDRAGIAIAKTVWYTETEDADPRVIEDENRLGLEVEAAQAENMEPMRAHVTEADADYVHIGVHQPHLDALPWEAPGRMELEAHIREHQARMVIIKRERPRLERVPWWKFVYDPDVSWDKRGWECEERSVRIQELIDEGYRNINPHNLPPERTEGAAKVGYEECTARIFEIHDRRTGRKLVIPADATASEGLFLYQGEWLYGGIDIYQRFISRTREAERHYGFRTIEMAAPILDELAQVDADIRRHVESHADYKLGLPPNTPAKVKAQLKNPDARFFDVTPEMQKMWEYAPPPIPETLQNQHDRLWNGLRRVIMVGAEETQAEHAHAVTATESSHRTEVYEGKKENRQERMGKFLANVARNFLALYRQFGSQAVLVRVIGPAGPEYPRLVPADIPDDLDVYLDIAGESDTAKAQKLVFIAGFAAWLATVPIPVDWQKLAERYARRGGIQHPEEFLVGSAQAGMAQPGSSQPGMPAEQNQGGSVQGPARPAQPQQQLQQVGA